MLFPGLAGSCVQMITVRSPRIGIRSIRQIPSDPFAALYAKRIVELERSSCINDDPTRQGASKKLNCPFVFVFLMALRKGVGSSSISFIATDGATGTGEGLTFIF